MTSGGLVEIEHARRMVLARAARLPAEDVPVASGALDRVLAEDVVATTPVPAFDNSAMDGFAVRAADLRGAAPGRPVRLEVVGESRAGAPAPVALAARQAIAISTGAELPRGADAIVRVEDTLALDGHVEISVERSAGYDVRRAGEDVLAGRTALADGTLLGPCELGVLASLGRTQARCTRRPRVSVLVGGDELLAPGEAMRAGGVRDVSSLTIPALVERAGASVLSTSWIPDDRERARVGIAAALEQVDVCVICAGVSVGTHDHVRDALAGLGAEQVFWGLALKPGRPLWFGTHGTRIVFGLPGNPVSAVVTFVLLVAPALRALLGLTPQDALATAVLERDYEKPAGRAHAVRCRLTLGEDGWHAEPTGPQGSHVLSSMLDADALALIPTEVTHARAGERVRIEPLRPLAWMPA